MIDLSWLSNLIPSSGEDLAFMVGFLGIAFLVFIIITGGDED